MRHPDIDHDFEDGETVFVPVVQYLFPHGAQSDTGTYVHRRYKPVVDALAACPHLRFEGEVTPIGVVSLTLTGWLPGETPDDDRDVLIELAPNGPAVRTAVEKLLTRTAAALHVELPRDG